MKNLTLVFATSLLVACGGSSSSSSDDAKKESESSATVQYCQVVDNQISIAEGDSCTIDAETKADYNLFFDGAASCTAGKIVTTGLTGNPLTVNGLTIACK